MKTRLFLGLAFAVMGCGGGAGGSGGNGAGNGGGGGGGGASGPQSYTLSFAPIDVPAGTEATQCIVQRLGNAAPLHVGTIHNRLGEASHHMIVYKVGDTVEQTTPFACQPFQDTLLRQRLAASSSRRRATTRSSCRRASPTRSTPTR